jgi:hypothetical protein
LFYVRSPVAVIVVWMTIGSHLMSTGFFSDILNVLDLNRRNSDTFDFFHTQMKKKMSEFDFHQCFNKQQRDFLLSITVHKARSLNVFNADTHTEISFNGETKKTRTYQSSDCPFYNEVSMAESYFLFAAS